MMATQRLEHDIDPTEQTSPSSPFLPEVIGAIRDARRNVANARMAVFEDECFRIGEMVRVLPINRILLIDALQDIAVANGLVHAHGEGLVQLMIVAGLRGGA